MLGERLKGLKKPPRMQTICHLAQKVSNFNSASGICCICLCPFLHSENFVEVAWRILSCRFTASAQQQGEQKGQDSGREAKPMVMTTNQHQVEQSTRERGKDEWGVPQQ